MVTSPGDDDRIVEEIYDALDAGEPARALDRARDAIRALGDDPVVRFLAGSALIELDRPAEAVADLRLASAADPDDAEIRATLAYALFKACRFEDAAHEAEAAIQADPGLPDALHVAALLDERRGLVARADQRFAAAARLDPDRYALPVRLDRDAFRREVIAAGALLPTEFRDHLESIAVTVEDVPSDAILRDENPPLDPELLGLFVGTALDEIRFDGPVARQPARILLFQRNLERHAEDHEQLRDEIARTLHHELAHFLGFEEDDMPELDLD